MNRTVPRILGLVLPVMLAGCSMMGSQDDEMNKGSSGVGCAAIGAIIGAGAGGAMAGPGGAAMGGLGGMVISQLFCGSELDSDGDGVIDPIDECPGTPLGTTVDAVGCPLDSDGDGFIDDEDLCPTVPGVAPDGCPAAVMAAPEPEPEPIVIVERVLFDFDKAELTGVGRTVLSARVLPVLEANAQVQVEVVGHTDSIGSDAYNLRLSARRAESVKAYLVSRGISATRLDTRGAGESLPSASNSTDVGRAENRRVEFWVSQ